MTIQDIIIMGNHSLRERSKEINTFDQDKLSTIQKNLIDTQNHYHGAGIAAPQIGINLRIIQIGFFNCSRYPDIETIEPLTLINPTFKPLSDTKVVDWEGCISVPGLRGAVERYQHIQYTAMDINQNKIERKASGFHARLIQHEIDHLDGILFVDKLFDPSLFAFEKTWDPKSLDLFLQNTIRK